MANASTQAKHAHETDCPSSCRGEGLIVDFFEPVDIVESTLY